MVLLQSEEKNAIGKEFEGLDGPVKLVAHLPANKNEPNENLKSLVMEIAEMDDRITAEVLMEGEDEEVDYVLERRPALVVLDKDGSDRGIIFYGTPIGNTLRSFVSLILMTSTGDTGSDDEAREKIEALDPNNLQVLVTPATPRCHELIEILYKVAYLNGPIKTSVVDLTEFPEVAHQYHAVSFPMTVGDDKLKFTGVYDLAEVLQILKDKISDVE